MACQNINGKQALEAVRATLTACDVIKTQYNENAAPIGESAKYTWDMDILIDDIKAHIYNAIIYYENRPKFVSNWCAAVKPVLTKFKTQKLTNASPAKDGLRAEFDSGEAIVYEAQRSLIISYGNAMAANEELASLKYRFDQLAAEVGSMKGPVDDLNKKIATIRQALKDLMCTEVDFNHDCMRLRNQYGQTRMFVWVDDVLKNQALTTQSMDVLIAKCNAFTTKHLK